MVVPVWFDGTQFPPSVIRKKQIKEDTNQKL